MAGSEDATSEESAHDADRARKAGAEAAMPRVDFSTFVLSLGTTALYQMGAVPDPQTGETGPSDALLAQQTIDTLEMLREKTRGNLDDQERNLIESLLYEIHMRFVELTR